MRKSIRLTGRKQLDQSNFTVTLVGDGAQRSVRLRVAESWRGDQFSAKAELRIKLVENKLVEVLHFGSAVNPFGIVVLNNSGFRAPSCQVRIVSREAATDGLLLASTK